MPIGVLSRDKNALLRLEGLFGLLPKATPRSDAGVLGATAASLEAYIDIDTWLEALE